MLLLQITKLNLITFYKCFRLSFLLLLLSFAFNSKSQSVGWEKSYGWDYNDLIESILFLKGNYYATGFTSLGSGLTIPIALVKIDSNGDTLFLKQSSALEGWMVDITSNNKNLFILGRKRNGNSYTSTLVTKLDTNGVFLWTKEYNTNISANVRDIVALPDGGAIHTGERGDFSSMVDFYAIRIDSNGNEVWNTTFFKGGYQTANYLTLLRDGSVMMSGYQFLGPRKNIFYLKFDQNGNEIASDTVFTGIDDGFYTSATITQAMNGDYFIVAGNTKNSSSTLFRMDSNFNYKWHYSRVDYRFFEPSEMLDGTILIAGETEWKEGTVIKLDAFGNFIKEVKIPHVPNISTYFNDVAYDGKGGAVLAGKIQYYGTPASYDFYFVKYDNVGIPVPSNYGCNAPQIQSIQQDFGTNLSNIILSNTSNENIQYSDILVSNWYFQDGTTLFGDTIYKTIPTACPTSFWAMLVVTDGVGCADTLTIDVCTGQILPNPEWPIPDTTVSIAEKVNKNSNVVIYPNPTNGEITIELNSFLVHGFLVKVYDIFGKVVYSANQQKTIQLINLTNQSSGIYIVEITTDEYVYREKVVVN